jgi:NTE family protein
LSGGGARAAYQAGVLRHILEISQEADGKVPFEILVGTSAGAINLAVLAAHASSFREACELMCTQWEGISTSRVFQTEAGKLARNALRWLFDLTLGGAVDRREPRGKSLVSTEPLAQLTRELLPSGAIDQNIQNGVIEAVAVSATDYDTGALTIFIQARRDRTLWRRYSRVSRYDRITPEHILASCSLPILFPAVRIGNAYYGDGSIRNTAPLSPAIHLGARKILAIGVREHLQAPIEEMSKGSEVTYPTAAKISGVLFDSIFLDALETDREQMARINRLLEQLPGGATDDRGVRMHPIEFLYLGPSQNLALLAGKHRDEMPRTIRYMLRGLGAMGESGNELLSYLLFEDGYCRALLDLGYQDARGRSKEIRDFLWPQ